MNFISFLEKEGIYPIFLFDFLEIEMVKVATAHNKEKTKESEK